MKADTKEADNIYNYYIKLEDVMTKYIEIKHNKILEENKKVFEINKKALEEKEQLLQIKDKIIKENEEIINNIKQLTYEEADKIGSIYLLSTDKPNITKCGRTKSILKRKSALQTAQVEDIEVLYEYKTSDDVLLESIIHKILNRYRLNREHFMCNIDYMKLIINTAGNVLDILNSSFEYISKEELLTRIYNKLELNKYITELIEENNEDYNEDVNDDDNIDNKLNIKDKILSYLDKDNLTDFENEITSNNKSLEKHLNLRLFLNDTIDNKSIISNLYSKIKICKDIMNVLNIKDLQSLTKEITANFNTKINNIWLNDNIKIIKKSFNIRTDKYDDFNYYNIYLLLITILKNLFDTDLFIVKKLNIDKIKFLYYIFDDKVYSYHISLIKKINIDIFDEL
jgi:hypothetical protein